MLFSCAFVCFLSFLVDFQQFPGFSEVFHRFHVCFYDFPCKVNVFDYFLMNFVDFQRKLQFSLHF